MAMTIFIDFFPVFPSPMTRRKQHQLDAARYAHSISGAGQSNAVPVPGSGINQLEMFAIRVCPRGAASGDPGLRHNGAAECPIFNQFIVRISHNSHK
jgi:hypothetical protein